MLFFVSMFVLFYSFLRFSLIPLFLLVFYVLLKLVDFLNGNYSLHWVIAFDNV